MSVYSVGTNLTSILKKYSNEGREKAKNAIINKVRFDLPKTISLTDIIHDVVDNDNYIQYHEFIAYIKQTDVIDNEYLLKIITEARQSVHLLKFKKFSDLIDAIISINWIERTNIKLIDAYKDFYIALMIVHNEYTFNFVHNLITYWIPNDNTKDDWIKFNPNDKLKECLSIVHKLIDQILDVIPMSYDIVIECIEQLFPYYKKPTYIIAGYLHNCLWLLNYRSNFTEYIFGLIFRKLVYLDVNAPRNKIEEYEEQEEEEHIQERIGNEADEDDGQIFKMDECNQEENNDTMSYQIAETLDVAMEKVFDYLDKFKTFNCIQIAEFFKIIWKCFNNVMLQSYNTHHSQFVMFYFCSFKPFLVDRFLNNLWNEAINLNVPFPIRQSSIGYIASFLARSKFMSLVTLKNYLSEMCNWTHQYIRNSDSILTNNLVKANIVFYSMCQAIFYVIAFRSRDLTANKQGLLFLQSLQLSALVTCKFNPLQVCLPAIATAFAGVTRQYQLAYCHTILEKNARRKLATFYANEVITPEECLDTFFPFDPYILKKSGKRIASLYLKYHANDAEDNDEYDDDSTSNRTRRRKYEDNKKENSEIYYNNGAINDDIDDFIIDKKPKLQNELSSSHDKELQFTYGSSPGFSNI